MLRVAGIVALFVLATACGQTPVSTVASPSPVIAQGNWNQSLAFAGEVVGQMSAILPDTADIQSECTGQKTHVGEPWSDAFYGLISPNGEIFGIVFYIASFSGPGTYQATSMTIEMHSADLTQVWRSSNADKITFTVDRSQQSGTIDATITNAASGKVGAQHVTGRWNCRG